MTTKVKSEPGRSQEPDASSSSPSRVPRAQVFAKSCTALSGALVGTWVRSRGLALRDDKLVVQVAANQTQHHAGLENVLSVVPLLNLNFTSAETLKL